MKSVRHMLVSGVRLWSGRRSAALSKLT